MWENKGEEETGRVGKLAASGALDALSCRHAPSGIRPDFQRAKWVDLSSGLLPVFISHNGLR